MSPESRKIMDDAIHKIAVRKAEFLEKFAKENGNMFMDEFIIIRDFDVREDEYTSEHYFIVPDGTNGRPRPASLDYNSLCEAGYPHARWSLKKGVV